MLVLMVYNIVGYIFVFSLSEKANRSEMQKTLTATDESSLVLLKFSQASDNDGSSFMRKSSHEIIADGKLYDVKEEFTKNGSTYFYCINDSKEEQLNNQLADNIQSNTGTTSTHNSSAKFFGKNILPEYTFTKSISFFSTSQVDFLFSFIARHFPKKAVDITSPPPRA